ncbi:MAG: 5'/3'-nucleotidase SurE [Nitrospinota bacterium]
MRILLSNDDGINSAGLKALHDALKDEHDVVVVAPDRERSAVSHSLTLHRPLRVREITRGWFSVDGTPTDCVHLALNGLLADPRPELVVAGINMGGNLGDDITYSGTVAAAIEGMLLGLPSAAVSLVSQGPFEFGPAAEFAAWLVRKVESQGLPEDTLLNVNVPDLPSDRIRGLQITRQGKSTYGEAIVEKVDPRGQTYFWVGSGNPEWVRRGDTDLDAVHEGRISVTPLHLNMTNEKAYQEMLKWSS